MTYEAGRKSADRAHRAAPPSALAHWAGIVEAMTGKTVMLFLDYDGTLTPIVQRPEDAVLSERMRKVLRRLAKRCTTAIVSGRDMADVRARVAVDDLYYAGSHGFEISGPGARHRDNERAVADLPELDAAEHMLHERLADIIGSQIERKRFSIAVHYRRVDPAQTEAVESAVDRVISAHKHLRKGYGKKVFELQPDVDWDKGKAVRWLLDTLAPDHSDPVLPMYIGDDVTDEDAFRELADDGVGIVVNATGPCNSRARYTLADPGQVAAFLERVIAALEETRA